MLPLLIALCVSFLLLLIVAAAAAHLTRSLWRTTPWLAPVYGLLGLGLAAQVSWALTWLDRRADICFAWLLLLSAVAVLVKSAAWRLVRVVSPLVLLTGGLLLVAVGHTFLWGGTAYPFETVQLRYVGLSVDNELPSLFAHDLWNDIPTHQFIGDWNGSDRPPLQSGLLLLVRPFAMFLGLDGTAAHESLREQQWGLATGIVAQFLWVPAAYGLLRALRFTPRAVMLAVLLVQATPFSIWNATFTWPKLLSAAFGLAALAVLVTQGRFRPLPTPASIAVAVALGVFGYLSHGSLAFAAPIFVGVGLAVLWGSRLGSWLCASGVAALVAGLLYAPWWAYARWADPSHARLLKWFFAGVVTVNTEPFLDVVRRAYATTPVSELVANRVETFQRLFGPHPYARVDFDGGWITAAKIGGFFSPWWALGVTTVVLIAFGALAAARPSRERLRRSGPDLPFSIGLILLALASLVTWALVIFTPYLASVNAGSYLWIVILGAVPSAWLAQSRPRTAVAALVLQVCYDAVVYFDPILPAAKHGLSGWAVAALGLGAAVVALALTARRGGESRRRRPAHRRDAMPTLT